MIHQVLALTWKDLKLFFRDAKALTLIFLQPFLFIVIMTYALAGVFGAGGKPLQIIAVNEDKGAQAAAVLDQLSAMKGFSVKTTWEGTALTRQAAQDLMTKKKATLALFFPPSFSTSLAETSHHEPPGPETKVLLMADPTTSDAVTDPILGTLRGIIEKVALGATLPRGIDYLFDRYGLDRVGVDRNMVKEQIRGSLSGGPGNGGNGAVVIEKVAPPGVKVKEFPNAVQQNVPGYTVYGVFWIATLLSVSLLREKREGTFQRLMAAPMSRTALLAGKLVPYYLINLLQIAVMMAASFLLFKMSYGHSLSGIILISLVLATTATGLGIFIAAFARTEAQANSLTVLVLLVCSALGGCFVPRFIMPETLKTVGLITPHAWALDAYQDLIVRGYGIVEILPKTGVLALFSVALFLIAVFRFRFE